MKNIVCLLLFFFAGSVSAGLIGDTVNIELLFGDSTIASNTHTVGGGEEGDILGALFYDFGDSAFEIRSIFDLCGLECPGSKLVAISLTDLDFGALLTDVSFDSALTDVSVDFGADFVNFSWLDQALPNSTFLSARFVTNVPEPTSIALLGLGLAAIGFSRRRTKQS